MTESLFVLMIAIALARQDAYCLGQCCGVSAADVCGWALGCNLPPPAARDAVRRALAEGPASAWLSRE